MDIFYYLIICLMGLCWGSFLNVVVYRSIKGESIINPPSHCPNCNKKLLWWHKIPLLSYSLLKGRCYFCGQKISIQYIIFEVIGLIIWLYAWSTYSTILDIVSVIIFVSMLVTLSYTDFIYKKVSVKQACVAIFAGFLFNRIDVLNSFLGLIIGSGLVLGLIFLGKKYLGKDVFGVGDVYLIAMLGSLVGINKLFLFIFYALIIEFLFILPEYIKDLINSNQIKTLKYLIFFVTACLFLYLFRNATFWGANIIFTGLLACILYFAYKLIKNLLLKIKNPKSLSYCSLAAAISISCIFYLI